MPAHHTRMNIIAAVASCSVALVLVLLKLWAFGQTGALSIAASLADSGMDLVVSLAAFAAIFYAARPPDKDHTFGHNKAEDLAALGQSLFILAAAGVIAWGSVHRLISPEPHALAAEGLGMAVMLVSIVLTLGLVLFQRRVARLTGNRVVAADALHYIGDLLPNIGAVVSLWVSSRYGIGSIDSIVALAAALFMANGALRIGKGAWNALMDKEAAPEVVAEIEMLAGSWPGIESYHDLRTRSSGSRVFVNLHVEIDGRLTLTEAHDIGAGLRHAILRKYPQADVIIHKDPIRHPAKEAADHDVA
ncbi:ferrous-iron efflux pump FieF [Aliiruegeria haliotis]|uniref:Ferrous-iron efflux pump FieF n=1 Tax=Aliiruegeria haliotis TaxID=1280846 RepID=A0A2T0RQU2_9RHOB|nr:cation diffusion facilitator family transporter [Aliiruegeria haliotis]PRY23565.1 ferrous-iron efflux pump FieF [Aliiruegeria haliotis]